MSITLENCGIVRDDILNGIVERLSEPLENEIYDIVYKRVGENIEEAVGKKVETIVSDAITKKIEELMANEIQPLTVWGEQKGKPKTINDILSDSLKEYWSQKVDRNGEPNDRYGNHQTRVEYIVKKVANDVLNDKTSAEFNQLILNAKASLSDGLNKAIREIADAHMGIKRKK